ncbi:hypothetical protein ACVIST_002491 [Bradyrhizobium elkanii]
MQPLGDFADQEAPGERAEQHELGPPRDLVEQPRQHVAAQHQRGRDQHRDAGNRQQHDADLQIVQARLHRQEQDREDVLQHQHAECDAPRQRIQLALLVEHLDDDHGRGQRAGDAEIDRVELAAADRKPDSGKERHADQAAAD